MDSVGKTMITWNYAEGNRNQHFRLDRLDNGNWTIKSVSTDKYLETFASSNGSNIYQCEPDRRRGAAAKWQEWCINWVAGGLT